MRLADGPHVVLGVEYNGTAAAVRIRELDGTASELVPLQGLELQFSVNVMDRVCLGHRSIDVAGQPYVDCRKPIDEPGLAKCRRCRAVDARFAANLHHAHTKPLGQIDAAVRGHLDQVNYLYLAGFRDGSVKIGTSSGGRRFTRLSEQGAWFAEFVATAADGIAVRVAEDLVTAELGIAQSVSIGRKLAGMAQPIADAELRETLQVLADRVAMLVAGLPNVSIERDSFACAAVADAVWDRVGAYPLKLGSGAHEFQVSSTCGRLAALERGSDAFVANLGELYGRPFTVGNVEPDDVLVQDSLF